MLCLFFLIPLYSQIVSAKEAARYSGKTITVCDIIYDGIFMSKSGGQPTFLNVGGAYPNSLMIVVIWGQDRKGFKYKPEEFYRNKKVCITGEIKMFNGKPEIVVERPQQIRLSE